MSAIATGCAEEPSTTKQVDPAETAGSSGSGGSGEAGTSGTGGDAPTRISFCAALQVMRAKCQRCHGDPLQNGAPVPFLTYEDTQAQYYVSDQKWSDIMLKVVTSGSMPYLALNDPPTSVMPPVQPLTADEKATLLGWLMQGALPEGGTTCP